MAAGDGTTTVSGEPGQTRVDRWLWSVRLCRTRGEASDACRGGHVRINGRPAKPAAPVRVGDTVEAHLHGRDRVVDVVRVIERRVGAADAATCLQDRSPAPEPRPVAAPRRDPGAGRPTKRDRRRMERLQGRRPN